MDGKTREFTSEMEALQLPSAVACYTIVTGAIPLYSEHIEAEKGQNDDRVIENQTRGRGSERYARRLIGA